MMDTSNLNRGDVVSMMPLPVDERGNYRPPMPAEACTDLGADAESNEPGFLRDHASADGIVFGVIGGLLAWAVIVIASLTYQKVFG